MAAMPCGAGCAKAAFGIEQENAGRNDLFTGSKTLQNFDAIGGFCAKLDLPRLEAIGSSTHEHVLRKPCIDNCVAADAECLTRSYGYLRGPVHAGA